MSRLVARLAVLVVCALGADHARAADVLLSLHVGVNAAPAGSGLATLRYADDDAVRFYDFARLSSERSWLLTVVDADTARRHSSLLGAARPPSRASLARAVDELAAAAAAARDRGDRVHVWLSWSGHGVRDDDGAHLVMSDGDLSPKDLEALIARVGGDRTHLFLDACHGEGVVRGRGLGAPLPAIDATDAAALFGGGTGAAGGGLFERHPHVGAVVATPAQGEAQEWSVIEAGVFTHEVLSGLAGLADVNGDGVVVASELHAFLAAANREVDDPRAQLRVVVEPMRLDPLTPLFDLAWSRGALLEGHSDGLGHFVVERHDGVRAADGHLEPGQLLRLALAPHTPYVVRAADGRSAVVQAGAGLIVALDGVTWDEGAVATRGAASRALAEGLFKSPYGRAYYAGFADQKGHVAVSFEPASTAATRAAQTAGARSATVAPEAATPAPDRGTVDPWRTPRSVAATALAVTAGAGAVVAVGLGASAAWNAARWQSSTLQRDAADALTLSVVLGGLGLAATVGTIATAGCAFAVCPPGEA